ncbi:hypothetical protein BGZ60DRAFT_435582 [Tricladium varicosporioides]|nr:hypothetical protein BGZ60DRAFT_435582 [Hymenoscyphus varicosporioides]
MSLDIFATGSLQKPSRLSPPRDVCNRCQSKSLSCVFKQHQRGRKPGTRLKRKLSTSVSPSHEPSLFSSERLDYQHDPPQLRQEAPPSSLGRTGTSGNTQWENEGLQPASILSKATRPGKFSLENILCVPNVLDSGSASVMRAPSPGRMDNEYDPLACNFLTFPVAIGLYDRPSFIRCLNPYICQLDPKLHTFEYVRQKSPFLLTTILAASSKAFHPSLHPVLRAHSEKLLGLAFMNGSKCVETVQAILIFTYWKEPDENRTWLLVGYAIRMCIELGWHELELDDINIGTVQDELAVRQTRNIERTWLILFVYDRSLSFQIGKPWMIDQSSFIAKSGHWHQHNFAVPGADLLLCAFVALRIVSAETLDLVSPSRSTLLSFQGEMLSKSMNNSMNSWENKWLNLFENETIKPCHKFMANFYGLHLRLLLNSHLLQSALLDFRNGMALSKSALWLCSSSAIGMLDQVSREFGPLKQLYFVQDSIHAMVAYAALFLIKMLVSLPRSVRVDFESHSIEAIGRASETFEGQCATEMTGCAMQARFLKTVVQKYQNLKADAANGAFGHQNSISGQPNPPTGEMIGLAFHNHDTGNNENQAIGTHQEHLSPDEFGPGILNDKEMWENLFTEVGFWMSDGVNLSEHPNMI